MNSGRKSTLTINMVLIIAISTVSLMVSPWIVENHRYVNAIWLLIVAVGGYFYIVYTVASRNWLDIRGVFHAVWISTIMLASLQLAEYQEDWQEKTWFCLAIAYAVFHIGTELGIRFGAKISSWINRQSGKKIGRITFAFKRERLFGICLGVTLFGFCCFIANILIRGYIPFFAPGGNSYLNFYTKFYLFAVASCMISGLCYYTLKTQDLVMWKKTAMYVCIAYSTFAFPILTVSRGTFLTSALSLSVAVFYLNKRRFWVLVACVVVLVGGYLLGSVVRGYSEAQLNAFFEPSKIPVQTPTESVPAPASTPETVPPAIPTESVPAPTSSPETVPPVIPTESVPTPTSSPETVPPTIPHETAPQDSKFFQLSGKAAFVYSYLTVSHDNFNEAVQNVQDYTYGVRQLAPFNVILRIPYISNAINDGKVYLVRQHLNTTNLIGDAYYDFGIVGVGVLMLIWAFIFGAIQGCYFAGEGPFALLALGNTMTPVAFCFFATWMSVFSHWMHWGMVLILWMIACISIEHKKSN